jgi:ethanolaminephosphotransferase
MYLPWGYDISMVGGTLLYLVTAVVGTGFWKVHLPLGLSPGSILALSLFAGTFLLSLPTTLVNTYKSYRLRTGKMRPIGEALRPLVSFFLAFALCQLWVTCSKNGILEADIRCFFFMSGALYANMSCRLIVAQMTNTRCELVNVLIYPLAIAVAVSLLVPGFPREAELAVVYLLTAGMTLAHLHYAVCVVIQMCGHLKIKCFKIKNFGEERLLDQEQSETKSTSALIQHV